MDDPAAQPHPPQARGRRSRHHARRDSPEHKLAVLRERLLTEAGAIGTAGDWAGALQAAARLPGESFANILLIEAQRAGATR